MSSDRHEGVRYPRFRDLPILPHTGKPPSHHRNTDSTKTKHNKKNTKHHRNKHYSPTCSHNYTTHQEPKFGSRQTTQLPRSQQNSPKEVDLGVSSSQSTSRPSRTSPGSHFVECGRAHQQTLTPRSSRPHAAETQIPRPIQQEISPASHNLISVLLTPSGKHFINCMGVQSKTSTNTQSQQFSTAKQTNSPGEGPQGSSSSTQNSDSLDPSKDCNSGLPTRPNQMANGPHTAPTNSDISTTHQSSSLKKFHGDSLTPNNKDIMRIYFNNCNSLEIVSTIKNRVFHSMKKKTDKFRGSPRSNSKLDLILTQMIDWQVNITCLAETCVAWDQHIPNMIARKIARSYDKTMCLNTTTSGVVSASAYKPGGSATLVDNCWSGRIVQRGEDPHQMGRWNYVTFGGRKDQRLTIITAYRAGKRKPSQVGPTTAIAQQDIMLQRQRRTNISIDNAFLHDLGQFLNETAEAGNEILLALDANEEYTPNSAIRRLAAKHGLSNIAEHVGYTLPATKPS